MSALPPQDQRLLTDAQLWELEQLFDRIAYHASPIRPRSPWAPEPAKDAPKPMVPFEVVFRKPYPGEAKKFKADANAETKKHAAQEGLARATVIAVAYPASKSLARTVALHDGISRGKAENEVREAFSRLLDEYPLAPEAMGSALSGLAGTASEEAEKG